MPTPTGNKIKLERYTFFILAAAAASFSVVSGIAASKFEDLKLAELLTHLFADACIIFICAELVERILLSKFNQEANARHDNLNQEANARHDNLGDKLTKKVEEVLRYALDDVKYADHYKIHFLPPRRSKSNEGVTYKAIAKAIEEAEWIKFLCTSGRDIITNSSTYTSLVQRIKVGPALNFTVLSCEPASEDGNRGMYASARGALEYPDDPMRASEDVRTGLRDFKSAFASQKRNPGTNFRWLYYDFVPQGWFFLTNNVGFAEFYHFGLSVRENRGIFSTCMGGRIPVVKFDCTSGLFQALNEYLSYLSGELSYDKISEAERLRSKYFKVTEVYNLRSSTHH